MKLKECERIDAVPGTNFSIIQNTRKFAYGIDAILLSEFARARGVLVDLGTGTAIIPIRIRARQKLGQIYGVEIQEEVADMARRSLELNKIEDIEIISGDLKDLPQHFGKHTVDTITSNPPYMVEDGLLNPDESFAISRHEVKCNIFDIGEVAGYLLRPLGRIFLIHRPDRLVDIFHSLRSNGIEPKRIRFVEPRLGAVPNLVLIEGVKGGRPELRYEKTMRVYNEDGSYTDEIERIYNRSCKNDR